MLWELELRRNFSHVEHLEIVELLIDSGANVNQGNIVDMVPLHWAVITSEWLIL